MAFPTLGDPSAPDAAATKSPADSCVCGATRLDDLVCDDQASTSRSTLT
jgi:hypothetical protein